MRTLHVGWFGLIAAAIFFLPAPAQAQSAIAGVVRDSSGGVLPGVNVEAKSPALIEGARSVITDSAGQYRIVDLRPGTYVVTFTLPGFNAVRREGIELPSNFTADVNADMCRSATTGGPSTASCGPTIWRRRLTITH